MPDSNKSFTYLVIGGLSAIAVTVLVALGFTFAITDQANDNRDDDFDPIESEELVDTLETV